MAFTLQTFVADPTLATGNMRVSPYAADPTAVLSASRLPTYVADPTLALTATRLPTYVTDPTLSVSAKIPSYVVPGAASWLAPVATGTAVESPFSQGTLPGIIATGTAIQSPTGQSHVNLPFVLAASTAGTGDLPTLELLVASGVAVTGEVGSSSQPVVPFYTATGTVASLATSSAQRELIVATGTGLAGALGVSAATVQPYQATGLAGIDAVGTSSVPLYSPIASGTAYLGTGASFSAVVLQTQTQSVTTYTNFVFNSFARFNGVTLAAGDSGLFSVGGDKDDGVDIDAAVTTGITDFNTSLRKRAERVYLGYRATGNLILRVRTDEVRTRDYLVRSNHETGLHGTHVKLGRGLEARYWQFEIRNQAGAYFTLDTIDIKPSRLSRRVGGADA